MRRTPLAALLTAVLLWPRRAPRPSPASDYAAAAVKATNKAREANDRTPFKVDECLHGFAVKQAKAMAAAGTIYHQDLGPSCRPAALSPRARTSPTATRPAARWSNQGWMKSDGHRANILNPGFKLVAVAARRDESGTWYAAQVFGRR